MFFKKKKSRIDPDELNREAQESLAETKSNQTQVNAVTAWLIKRSNQNGFGEDFEISLIPKES